MISNSAHAFNAVSSSSMDLSCCRLPLRYPSPSPATNLQNRVAIRPKSESATSGANALLAFDKLLEDDALFSKLSEILKSSPRARFSPQIEPPSALKVPSSLTHPPFAPSSPFIFFSKADRFAYSPNRNDFKIRFKDSFATISFGLTRNLERRQFIAAERISR